MSVHAFLLLLDILAYPCKESLLEKRVCMWEMGENDIYAYKINTTENQSEDYFSYLLQSIPQIFVAYTSKYLSSHTISTHLKFDSG